MPKLGGFGLLAGNISTSILPSKLGLTQIETWQAWLYMFGSNLPGDKEEPFMKQGIYGS